MLCADVRVGDVDVAAQHTPDRCLYPLRADGDYPSYKLLNYMWNRI